MTDWPHHKPAYSGDALTDLHDGAGTIWQKDADGSWWPVCPCHAPEGKRPKAAKPAKPKPAPEEPAIDEQTALRLLATWLKRLAKEKR